MLRWQACRLQNPTIAVGTAASTVHIGEIRVIRGFCIFRVTSGQFSCSTRAKARKGFSMTRGQGRPKQEKEIKYEKTKHYMHNNSAGAWLLCDGLGALRVGHAHARTGYHHCYV